MTSINIKGQHIFNNAQVSGNALVSGDARVSGNARVSGDALVFGKAQVSGNARVFGDAQVTGNVQVSGNALVSGDAQVYGIRRSDGYVFVYVYCVDGKYRVIAGCRYFTMKEAKAHWQATRKGTSLGRETMAILKCLEILHKVKPEGMV